MARIILASASPTRAALLKNSRIAFTARPAALDERAIEAPLVESSRPPAEIAGALAEAKALSVAKAEKDALVIGADQVLAADGRRWNKPASLTEAREQLMELSGRAHQLHSAIVLARDQTVIWRHAEIASLTMRPLSAGEVDAYLGTIGETALTSVGAYQIEGPGIQLFERIEGDYFAILGLPLLPLLAVLRREGAVAW